MSKYDRIKKSCDGCRADDLDGLCNLGHRRKIKTKIGGRTEWIPVELCPKPTTYKKLIQIRSLKQFEQEQSKKLIPYKNTNNRWQIDIPAVNMVHHGSWGADTMGDHTSTMELFQEPDSVGYSAMIEWDIPGIEETEHIHLAFDDNKTLIDYDGIMSMPKEAVEFLEALGYNADYAKEGV